LPATPNSTTDPDIFDEDQVETGSVEQFSIKTTPTSSIFNPDWTRSKHPAQLRLDCLLDKFYDWTFEYGEIQTWVTAISSTYDKASASGSHADILLWRVETQERVVEGRRLLCELKELFDGLNCSGLDISDLWSQAFELITEIQSAVSCVSTILMCR
jgi:hypothetical protein